MFRRMLIPGLLAVAVLLSSGCKPTIPTGVAWSYATAPSSIVGLTIDNTNDGGLIVGGGYNGTYSMYGLKLDAFGGKMWDGEFSNLSPDSSHSELWRHEAVGARQTPDGGYILLGVGHFYKDGLPEDCYLLVKTDAGGEVVWSKAYAPDNPYNPGHLCCCNEPAALWLTDDGGYVAFGSSYVGGYSLASILKTDADGNMEIMEVINDNGKAYEETITGGQQTDDGGYILTGYSSNGAPHGYMALLIKLDADGKLAWSDTYQYEPANHGAVSNAVIQTADGGYLMGGILVNDITKVLNHGFWMAKTDGNGNQLWARNYANGETLGEARALVETPQGDIVSTGSLSSGKMGLAKFTGTGALLWNFSFDDLPGMKGNDLVLTGDGGCAVVGSGAGSIVAKVNNVYAVVDQE